MNPKDNIEQKGKKDTNEIYFINNFSNYSYFKHDNVKDKYTIFDKNDKEITSILFTKNYCSDIKGYAGEIPLIICIDSLDTIRKIIALDNEETPNFFQKLIDENFLDNWNNLKLKDVISKEVDAISGATYSCSAVEKTLIKRLEIYLNTVSSIQRFEVFKLIGLIFSFLVLIFSVISFYLKKNTKLLRIILLLSCVGIIGFWQGEMLNIALLHNWLINGMDISSQIFLLTVLFVSILIPILSNKQFYCYYLCPFGSAQELIGKINPHKFDVSGRIFTWLKYIRFIFLFIIFLLLIMSADVAIENLEPFLAFNFNIASLGVLILASVFLFLSIIINRPWCKFFCPTGALLSMFSGPILKFNFRLKSKNVITIIISVLLIIITILTILVVKTSKNSEAILINKKGEETLIKTDALTTILKRKSVREYTNQAITKDTLELILKAAMAAPSARNLQPWKFYSIQNKSKLKYLGDNLVNATMLKNATAAIIVCGDLEKAYCEVDSAYWVQDCCAASENILLACESLKLGSVWTAVYPYPDRLKIVKEYFNLPKNIIPLNIIVIGYPAKEEKVKNKWDPNKIIWEK